MIVLRKRRNLSQEEFARELGISGSYLSLLESGKRPLTRRVVQVLARYFQLPAAYFILEDLRLADLSERHRSLVEELRRELVEPALERLLSDFERPKGSGPQGSLPSPNRQPV